MTRLTGRRGLTVVEVLIALVVIGIVMAAFTTAAVSTMHHTSITGARTEAVQILNYLGRRAAGGDETVLPVAGTPNVWDYGDLPTAFSDLHDHGGFSDPARYKATITNAGTMTFTGNTTTGASAVEYDLQVCYHAGGGDEYCVTAATLGPEASGSTTAPPLPGIN